MEAELSGSAPTSAPTSDYRLGMADAAPWTADDLLAMSPNERERVIRAGLVTDPDAIPASVVERARHKADARIAATESE